MLGACPDCLAEHRLAGSGLSDHEPDAATPFLQAVDKLSERCQLSLAAGQRRSRRGSRRMAARVRADQPPGLHRLRLALDREVTERLEVELLAGQLVGRLAHIRLARWRRSFEPLGQDDDVSQHSVVEADVAPQQAADPVAGVDADV